MAAQARVLCWRDRPVRTPSPKRILVHLFAALLVLAPLAARAQAQPRRARVLIGLIPELNIFKQKARFKLLGEYLSRKIGVPVQFESLSRYGNILESFESERLDGAFFGSFTGALAIEKLGVVPLARPVNLDETSSYWLKVTANTDGSFAVLNPRTGQTKAYPAKK